MNKKKVVVTGGIGFIGSHLVQALQKEEYEVVVVDTEAGQDINDAELLCQLFVGATFVFHLAALPRVQYSIEHPEETHRVNVDGTLAVLTAAKEAGVRRVIFSSSSAVYGDVDTMPISESQPLNPKSPYALHKYIGELYCRLFSQIFGLETVSLRYFNVYGPGMKADGAYAPAVAIFLEQHIRGVLMTITGDGTQTRDFVHVDDVVRANILASTRMEVGNGESINIGSGTSISMNKIAEQIGGEVTYLPPRLEPHDTLADISLAQKLLGWTPTTTFDVGLAELKKQSGLI